MNKSKKRLETEREIISIMFVYDRIMSSVDKLSDEEKQEFERQTEVEISKFRFKGFDLNDYPGDKHYSYFIDFLKEGAYPQYKDMYLNSHSSSTIRGYRKMIEIFESLNKPGQLSLSQLIELGKLQRLYLH